MKNANQILNSIQNKPQFSNLSKHKCINKIQSLFMPTFQRFVKFAYIKNNILFFVLTHNAGKQEFDNNIQNIKSALNFHMPKECEGNNIQDIKAFVSHTIKNKKDPQVKKALKQTYPERAKGEFDIDIKDKKLNALIKSIQTIIKEKHES